MPRNGIAGGTWGTAVGLLAAIAAVPATPAKGEGVRISLELTAWEKIDQGDWHITAGGIMLDSAPYRSWNRIVTRDSFDLSGGGWLRVKFRMGDGASYQAGNAYAFHGDAAPPPAPADRIEGTFFTTDHSFMSSYVVTPGVWYYRRTIIDPNGAVQILSSTGDYDDRGGNVVCSDKLDLSNHLAYLDSLRVIAGYCDNYGVANAYFELGEAVISPEPATLSLLALGGLGVVRRRRKMSESPFAERRMAL